jgi:hypothetical protein
MYTLLKYQKKTNMGAVTGFFLKKKDLLLENKKE